MITLGKIVICDKEHLCLSRELAFAMAADFFLSETKAAQLATFISELGTRALITHNSLEIQFSLRPPPDKSTLFIMITAKGLELLTSKLPLNHLFDKSHFIREQESNGQSEQEILTSFNAQIRLPKLQVNSLNLVKQRKHFAKLEASAIEFQLKNNPEVFLQQERLSGLGTFVAGLAHELNNPLMGILNYVQYCSKHTTAADKRAKPLKSAEREIERCVSLVEDLLRYSRVAKENEGPLENFDVSSLLQQVFNLLRYRLKNESIDCFTEWPETQLLVPMRVNGMEQVLVNLLINAMDALESRPQKKIFIKISRARGACIIEIEDTGCGIKPEQIKQIFTPFFTTKQPGKGTGLGMAICQRIIEEHKGKIEIKSKVNQGTSIWLMLPLN